MLRYGFAMELFLEIVYLEIIMIIGQWSINAFIRYIRIQFRYLSKDISDLMVSTQNLYTILEVEVIYYTPGQPRVQPHRLNTH